jgi:hypothetical protein
MLAFIYNPRKVGAISPEREQRGAAEERLLQQEAPHPVQLRSLTA